jgi:hypothetical protein
MTTTTDRLVASPKTEPKPGNCWVLTDEHGADHDDYGSVIHHESAATAANWATEFHIEGYRPRQIDSTCMCVSCSCCGYVYDEDDDGCVHFESLDEARPILVQGEGWTVTEDGTWKCQPCAAGECDECGGEVARG